MNDSDAKDLLRLLSLYAESYGKDCDSFMSVGALADDLRDSITNFHTSDGIKVDIYHSTVRAYFDPVNVVK